MQSDAPHEIEAKYTVADPASFALLASLRELGPYQLSPAPAADHQLNRYFDTADRRLRAARHGYRVRVSGGRAIAALKGPASAAGVGQRRMELEQPLASLDLVEPPDGPLREHLRTLTGAAMLEELLTITTERLTIAVSRAGAPIAELALDQSQIKAGGRTALLREIEIELRESGDLEDMRQIAALIGERCPIVAEQRSKLERGLLLQEGRL